MGQKVHPIGFRLGIVKPGLSRWIANKHEYADLLAEDRNIRTFITKKLRHAGIPKIEIERSGTKTKVCVYTARPGIVIGRKGVEVDALKADLEQLTGREVLVTVQEVKSPEVNAQLVAESIAAQLERRIGIRRVVSKAITTAMRLGAGGVKIRCSGRLGGSEIARTQWHHEGRVPLHTLRADIDYGFAESATTFGKIGVKVWIYHVESDEDEHRAGPRPSPRPVAV